MKRWLETTIAAAALIAAAAVFIPLVVADRPWPAGVRDILAAEGYRETGAENLVSAIYLGYRAFDTIGETIVLLTALLGSISLIGKAANSERRIGSEAEIETDSDRRGNGPATGHRRTELIDTVAGKLAPIVLLFGMYVMAFGHRSPGGGFQGGVVLASGVVFIALGRREGGVGAIAPHRKIFSIATLSAVEAAAFAALLLLASAGTVAGGFTANPLPPDGVVPPVAFIIAMNAAIGLKVGSGVALLCVFMLKDAKR